MTGLLHEKEVPMNIIFFGNNSSSIQDSGYMGKKS